MKSSIIILVLLFCTSKIYSQNSIAAENKITYFNQTEGGMLFASEALGFTIATVNGINFGNGLSAGIETGIDYLAAIPLMLHFQNDFQGKTAPYVFISAGYGFLLNSKNSKGGFNGMLGLGIHSGTKKIKMAFDLGAKIIGQQVEDYSVGGGFIGFKSENLAAIFLRAGIQIK